MRGGAKDGKKSKSGLRALIVLRVSCGYLRRFSLQRSLNKAPRPRFESSLLSPVEPHGESFGRRITEIGHPAERHRVGGQWHPVRQVG